MNLIEKKLLKLTKIQIQKIYQILKINKYDKNNSKKKLINNLLKPLKMKYRIVKKRGREIGAGSQAPVSQAPDQKRRKKEQVCVNKQHERYYTDVSEEECEILIKKNGAKFGKILKDKIYYGSSNYRYNRPLERPYELPPRTLPSTENFDEDLFEKIEINGKKYIIKEYDSEDDRKIAMSFYEENKDIMPEHIEDKKHPRRIYIRLCHPLYPEHFSYGEFGGIWRLLNEKYDYQNKRFGGKGRDGKSRDNKYLFWHDVEFVLDNYYLTDIERKILEQISVKKTKKIPNFPQLYLKGILPKISKDFDHEDLKLSNFVYSGDLNGQFKVLLIDPLLPSDYA